MGFFFETDEDRQRQSLQMLAGMFCIFSGWATVFSMAAVFHSTTNLSRAGWGSIAIVAGWASWYHAEGSLGWVVFVLLGAFELFRIGQGPNQEQFYGTWAVVSALGAGLIWLSWYLRRKRRSVPRSCLRG